MFLFFVSYWFRGLLFVSVLLVCVVKRDLRLLVIVVWGLFWGGNVVVKFCCLFCDLVSGWFVWLLFDGICYLGTLRLAFNSVVYLQFYILYYWFLLLCYLIYSVLLHLLLLFVCFVFVFGYFGCCILLIVLVCLCLCCTAVVAALLLVLGWFIGLDCLMLGLLDID